MTKFVVIYNSPETAEAVMESNDASAAADGMQAWMAWAERAREHLTDLGTPLGNGRQITTAGVSPITNGVSGYSILDANDADHAVALMDGHPHLLMPGSSIVVYEALAIPGM